jgi:hypothetical protein
LQPLLANLFSLCASYLEYELSLKFALECTPFDVMAIVAIVANHPSITSSLESKIEMGPTCSLEPACLSSF